MTYLESLERKRDRIKAEYFGVRPSWVSSELATLNTQIAREKASLEGEE